MTYTLIVWLAFMDMPVTQVVLARGLAIEECQALASRFIDAECRPEINI